LCFEPTQNELIFSAVTPSGARGASHPGEMGSPPTIVMLLGC